MACANDSCGDDLDPRTQRGPLIAVLVINAVMFVVELGAGVRAQSSGLIADSLDMLGDALVYGVALWAVYRSAVQRAEAALVSGSVQVLLALGAAGDLVRRAIFGSQPEASMIVGVAVLALLANLVCFAILTRHRDGGVHMRASWICSRNDLAANAGVIAGGALVAATGSPLPDLAIGAAIVGLVLWSSAGVLRDGLRERRRAVVR